METSRRKTVSHLSQNRQINDVNNTSKVMKQQQKVRQAFFRNILLLGFDRYDHEKKDHIPYNENMFAVPNNKGALPILYFLMEKLDPEEVKTRFKGIWPVFDKKEEQCFRKELCNWLNKIAQEDQEAGFNTIFPSLFLSPGGYKFEQFLFYLSRYVLLKTLKKQCNIKDVYLKCPILKSSLPQMVHIPKILKQASSKHRQSFLMNVEENLKAYTIWHKAANQLIEECKNQRKRVCLLKSELKKAEEKIAKENSEGVIEPSNEVISPIKDKWKGILHQIHSQDADRETIQSVIESFESKHKLDRQTINASIPDHLIQAKEQQIQERKISSLYREGKLDIVSLIKFSNLSLQMYYEKFLSMDFGDCKESISEFEMLSKKHNKFLENIEMLRREMIESLEQSKDSVKYLTEKLNENTVASKPSLMDFKMIPHSPPRNLLLMPRENQSQTERSIDSKTILNTEEEAMKILRAAAENCIHQTLVNPHDSDQKNIMLSEDLSGLETTEWNIKQTEPSSKLVDSRNSYSSLGVSHSVKQAITDVKRKGTNKIKTSSTKTFEDTKFSTKQSHEKAMKDYVSSVVNNYKTGGKEDLQDVAEALSVDPFQSKDKLTRSPVTKENDKKLRSTKDSAVEEFKSDLILQSPNSLNQSDPISVSPLLTPSRVSYDFADLSISSLSPSIGETTTVESQVNQSNSSFQLLLKNNENCNKLFTLPIPQATSENSEPFDSIGFDVINQFEQPGCLNSGEIDQSLGQSLDYDFKQSNSESQLFDSLKTTTAFSEYRNFRLSLSENPLEDESDSILVED